MGIKTYLVNRVRESAAKYNGSCTFPFSQALEPVSAMIGGSKVTSGGICQALSEMWVVFHAHDQSLWNWLYTGAKINSSALANIAYNFKYGSTVANGTVTVIDDQDMNSDLWFLQYGIRRRSSIIPRTSNTMVGNKLTKIKLVDRSLTQGSRQGSKWSMAARGNTGIRLGQDLVSGSMVKNMGQGDGTYRMIGIFGAESDAHCMAAFVGTDVAFFDPNFGEFWFGSRADFAKWFGDAFWSKAFYNVMLSGKYTIRDYARAVGAGHSNLTGKF